MKHELYLMRHGEAESHAAGDPQRRLTRRGAEESRLVIRALCPMQAASPFSAIYASPYVRARQTAEIAAEETGFTQEIVESSLLTPETDPRQTVRELISRTPSGSLFVCHMPLVGGLVDWLVDGVLTGRTMFATAGLVKLTGDLPEPGLMEQSLSLNPATALTSLGGVD